MHSNLTEMLSTAHRDELRRQAFRHHFARESRNRRRSAALGTTASRVLSLRFIGRGNHVRPAIIT